MAVGWFASFKDIPWAKALNVAPAIVDKGKRLWSSVAEHKPRSSPDRSISAGSDALSAAEVRVHALELKTLQLEEEAVSSFDVVRSIAEQHSQIAEQHAELVSAVDVLLVRTRVLSWACALLGLSTAALLVVVLALSRT